MEFNKAAARGTGEALFRSLVDGSHLGQEREYRSLTGKWSELSVLAGCANAQTDGQNGALQCLLNATIPFFQFSFRYLQMKY